MPLENSNTSTKEDVIKNAFQSNARAQTRKRREKRLATLQKIDMLFGISSQQVP
jgi:hypothetical protein